MITNQLLVPPVWPPINLQQIRDKMAVGTLILRLSIQDNRQYLSTAKQLLPETEQLRANRFIQQDDQLRFVLGRRLLREILGLHIQCSAVAVPLVYNAYGKPALPTHNPVKVHFNISHSGDYVLIALSDTPVGIDTEHMKAGFAYQDFASTVFSTAETNAIKQSPIPYETFYLFWTRKEAFLKNKGCGLALSPQEIPALDGQHLLPVKTPTAYAIHSFSYARDYIGSICLKQTAMTNIHFYTVGLG
ncbi:4'-phosphopantetheinyl transferase superfamily protein [Olivibacter ginsenosidimutans]|uniref:4'-phosphopantetheinyl transferase superfamily protein n=1 Tax=Olivibacter ginsenosidimutans TaxID=1176537 RepID=A0ABP9ADS9_9SPHI